ncbi:DUF4058 family protein [Tautonia rosea]|uniref:DUF4058 family protein n=1 Tax=Tautonia rosea TaxID=2728037 RepID=UPI001475FB5C|nr:DUF4058 family protein [Tautonia rosea]
MPIHDWTRVEAGTYHDFHQDWTIEIRRTLNRGILPEGYFAMADQRVSGPEPDIVALRLRGPEPTGGLAVAEVPPRMKTTAQAELDAARYVMKANRIVIRQGLGRVVAMIEVVSPGNKASRSAVGEFVSKAVDFLRHGIHFLMIDPFPTGPRDPQGLAHLIWDELVDHPPGPRPSDAPLTVAAFDAGPPLTTYIEPLAVGDSWPEAPLFLAPGWYVNVPLEATYRASWEVTPLPIRDLVERPKTIENPEV